MVLQIFLKSFKEFTSLFHLYVLLFLLLSVSLSVQLSVSPYVSPSLIESIILSIIPSVLPTVFLTVLHTVRWTDWSVSNSICSKWSPTLDVANHEPQKMLTNPKPVCQPKKKKSPLGIIRQWALVLSTSMNIAPLCWLPFQFVQSYRVIKDTRFIRLCKVL